MGAHGASTQPVYISFALRRGTIAQVTTALDAAQRAAEAELAVNEVGLAW